MVGNITCYISYNIIRGACEKSKRSWLIPVLAVYSCTLILLLFYTVTGDANFTMTKTSLTVGGFNQPAMARSLIELPGNAEKGLSQRFLWMFPKPVNSDFQSLAEVDQEFVSKLGKYL